MLATAPSVVALIAWSATAAIAGMDLWNPGAQTGKIPRVGLSLSAIATALVALALLVDHGAQGLLGPPGRLVFLALVIGIGARVILRHLPMRATVAAAAPIGAALMALFLFASEHVAAPENLEMKPLLLVHIGLVLMGVGSFMLAAIAAGFYLALERQLRRREFGRLFQRLPSLEELDTASFRLVLAGFTTYTVALILGFVRVARADVDVAWLRVGLALIAWGIFATVIHTRVTTGWRGRQSAMMTVAGCLATLLVLAGYLIR